MSTINNVPNRGVNTFTITVPKGTETSFLRTMSKNMGWKLSATKKKKNEDTTLMTEKEYFAKIDRAKEQVEKGEMGPKFDSAADLINYIKSL